MRAWLIRFFFRAGILVCCAQPVLAQESQQSGQQQGGDTPGAPHYWDCISPVCTYTHPKPGSDEKPVPYGGGTPLDVILNTRYWTDVPEAKPFVRATRPPPGALDFRTTGGKDIERAKLKTPAELKAMEDELDHAGAAADRAAGVRSNFHIEKAKPPRSAAKTN